MNFSLWLYQLYLVWSYLLIKYDLIRMAMWICKNKLDYAINFYFIEKMEFHQDCILTTSIWLS